MYQRYCAIKGCTNASKYMPDLSFYSVDKNAQAATWLYYCDPLKIKENRQLFICSQHFADEQFKDRTCKRKGVRPGAIPCLRVMTEEEEEQDRILCDHDIPVGACATVGDSFDGEEDIALNNRGLKKKKRTRTTTTTKHGDHDYSVNINDVYAMRNHINRLESKLRVAQQELRKRTRQRNRSQASAEKWKAKALHRGKLIRQQQRTTVLKPDGLLGELFRNSKKAVHGVRYSGKVKNLALAIYYCSPNAYELLRKQLRLPSKSMIKRWLSCLEIREGFSDNILILMTEQAKHLPVQERVVTLLVDETKIKPNYVFHEQSDLIVGCPTRLPGHPVSKEQATSVLVVMIKSIVTGRKQCIAFFYSKNGFKCDELTTIIEQSINKVQQTGFIPKVLINDQNSTNQALLKKFGVTIERPYFEINGSRIYAMYDPPHLLKSSRNNLLHHNALYKHQIAQWDHLRQLFEEDRKHPDRAVPKLTPEHLYLAVFSEMRVSLAAETLSETAYGATKMYVESNVLPEECMNTAEYCRDINRLFDTFNASRNRKEMNKQDYRQPISESSKHWDYLDYVKGHLQELEFIDKSCDTLEKLESTKPLNKTSRVPPFIKGWLQDIVCLKMLFDDLSHSFSIGELETRQLNQDDLEHFFGQARMRNSNNSHPDCSLFKATYRAIVVNQMLEAKGTGNCEANSSQTMINVEDFSKIKLTRKANPPASHEAVYTNSRMEVFEIPRVHNMVYTAKWLEGALLHPDCRNKLLNTSKSTSLLAECKGESSAQVSDSLVQHLAVISNRFDDLFDKFFEESPEGVLQKIESQFSLDVINSLLCEECCKSLTHKYIVLRIRAKIKSMNQDAKIKRKSSRKSKQSSEGQKARKLNIQ